MKKLEKNFFDEYNGLRFSVVGVYIIAFLPVLAAIWGLLGKLTIGTIGVMGLIGGQFYYLIIIIPILFIALDVYALIKKERETTPLKQTFKKHTELFVLLVFLVWCFVSVILQLAFFGTSYAFTTHIQPYFIQEGLMLFLYYAIIILCAFFVKDKKVVKNVIFIILITSIVLAILSLIDPRGGHVWFITTRNTFWANMFINSNHYGYFLTITIMVSSTLLCIAKKKWLFILSLIGTILLSCVMMFNDTLGALLAVFASLILLPIILSLCKGKFNIKYLLPLGIFIASSFSCFFIADKLYSTYENAHFFKQFVNLIKELFVVAEAPTSDAAMHAGTDRWSLWVSAFKEIKDSPIIGTGNVLLRPHNEYLQYAQVFGLPSLILYLAAFIIIFIKAIKYRKQLSGLSLVLLLSIMAYLIGACFGNTMPHTMPVFCLFVGFLIRWLNDDISNHLNSKTGYTT